jgi:hypothetical protein
MTSSAPELLLPSSRAFLEEDDLSDQPDVDVEELTEKYTSRIAEDTQVDWQPSPDAAALIAKEVSILQLRKHWDPKRFYKSMGNSDNLDVRRLQLGTVIEAPHEFYTAERLRRRERKPRILDEVMTDQKVRSYVKRRFRAVQERAQRTAEASRRRRPRQPGGRLSKRTRK